VHVVVAGTLLFLFGCLSQEGDTSGGGCTSHYETVADAPTRQALRQALLRDVDPRVRSLRVIDEEPGDDKVTINLVNRKDRRVMSLDMWQQGDGRWTAQQWSQCID
jgi:hypothetical protein